jgi:predicted esterase
MPPKIIPRCLAVVWLAGCSAAAVRAEPGAGTPADERGKVVQRDYVFDPADPRRIPYALFVPTSYAATKPAPLIVLLHGWGSDPWQVMHYRGIVDQAEKRGYIVVAPFGYNKTGGYGNPQPLRRSGWSLSSSASPPDVGERSEKDVLNVLALIRAQYSIDPKRIYLMGHSMGGGGALYLGIKYKGQWAALAAMAPAIFSSPQALTAIRDTPIIIVQGERDRLVPAENTRRWVDEMKALQMDYQYIEIKGGGHFFSILANPAMIAEVFDFFDSHRRR